MRGEWPSGPASSINFTEVKHGCVRSDTGWATFQTNDQKIAHCAVLRKGRYTRGHMSGCGMHCKLNSLKKSSGEIPTDILKLLSGLCIDQITFNINKMFECSEFPDKLKLADVSPIIEADDSTLKFNFRPVSVLPALSKVLDRIMAKQMAPFSNTRLSSLLCGFRDGYSTQHTLFRLIEACRSTLEKKGCVGMVLMDLSKAYDCLSHDLLIAKLAAYGFGLKSLNLFSSYLSNRKQRVKYGNSFSEW